MADLSSYINISANTVALTGNISANNLGNISAINLNGSSSQVLLGNGTYSNISAVGSTTIILDSVTGGSANWTANYTGSGGKLLVTAYATAFVTGVGSYTWALRKNGSNVATSTMYWNATSTHIPLNPISYLDTSGSTSPATWSIFLPAGMTADTGDDATITVLETTGITDINTSNITASGNVTVNGDLTVGGTLVNSVYFLEAYASETYTLPGSFTEDICRYSYVSSNVNVSSSWFNTSTYTFTPQKAGYWEIIASYDVYRNAEASMVIKKNGSIVASAGSFNAVAQQITKIVYLNGSTDYINIYNYGGAALSRSQYAERSWFQARWVGE